ncbi:hypothetical protein PENANT_c008G04629 [Penicillium antarcticum]|uniref:TauD/TfdA-like domain-containing protein n=1 Tax=Penicillium antarcticum TaxID=416450 RepID=A0A1V6QA93_9EURO|nr:uncharacterized protein N7508_007089 [Penicillium antarcticum]KAJ5302226.1 hypothetical protein N7508_007089 [Penicillium antarcticum]OQD86151.1 hypothetical protein PENANT_c008G04629 [Penicillium antarcticum]
MLSNVITALKAPHIDIVEATLPAIRASTIVEFVPQTKAYRNQEALVDRIAEIIASYRICGPDDRYEDIYKPRLLENLRYFVSNSNEINFVVPAYPFKSPNHEDKVLGPDPDVGERLSLEHLNSLGARITQIYPGGAQITIVSDGCCYNDLLGVSDEETYRYTEGLHRIVDRLGLRHIRFADPFDLLDGAPSVPVSEEEYVSRIDDLKERLFKDCSGEKPQTLDHNATLTYRGYIKFLMSDLATFYQEKKMSKSAIKKHSAVVARAMIERGQVFSALVAAASPPHVRLSIHAGDNTNKLSVALLPQKRYSNFPVTPWHNTPCLEADQSSVSLGRKPSTATNGAPSYRICHDDLGLQFLCADVPMYGVIESDHQPELHPLYPFGLKVRVPRDLPMTRMRLDRVAELARVQSPILFEGLDSLQYTAETGEEFQRVAGRGLSLSLLHEGVAAVSAVASYFVQIPAEREDGDALVPFVEAAAALDDVRLRVLHRWQAGDAVVCDHRIVLPVHLSPSFLRVLRGD